MYITPTDLLKRYAAGERNFAGIRFFGDIGPGSMLCEIDLSNIILSGAYLYRVNLTETDLSGATMVGTYLVHSILRMADLSGANLTGANLSRAYLRSANLRKANLTGANLTKAVLAGADLTDVCLEGANLSQVDLSEIKLYNNLPRNSLHTFAADEALLWETTLPDGTFEKFPRYYSVY